MFLFIVHIQVLYTCNLCFSLKLSLKYPLILFFYIFSISSFTFSSLPTLYYFMPFRNISCSTFTIWCNKHNQQFTVTHIFHSFRCTTNSRIAILLAASQFTFIISLKDIPLILSVSCQTLSRLHTFAPNIILDSFNISYASHKSNPSSVLQGYTEIPTLGHL